MKLVSIVTASASAARAEDAMPIAVQTSAARLRTRRGSFLRWRLSDERSTGMRHLLSGRRMPMVI